MSRKNLPPPSILENPLFFQCVAIGIMLLAGLVGIIVIAFLPIK